MDLRWALDVWRESGAHWNGEPLGSVARNTALRSRASRTKRRRPNA